MPEVHTEWWFICSNCGEKVGESELSEVGWNENCHSCNGEVLTRLND